jgi:hypothetical protein
LASYLSDLIPSLGPLPTTDYPLFLHLQIGVSNADKLLTGCDLENYLFPLFGTKWLPHRRFALVSAHKRVGALNRLTIGIALPDMPPSNGWCFAMIDAGPGYDKSSWKERVRDELAANSVPLAAGAAEVQIGFRCSPGRNWTNLWKPSGDSMGPILGVVRSDGFNPCDDRIVDIKLHRFSDRAMRHSVQLHYWWRLANV